MWKFRTVKSLETDCVKPLEEKGSISNPAKTYNTVCGFLTSADYRQLIRGHSCMLGAWMESNFQSMCAFSIAEMILWQCLWKLMQRLGLSRQYFSSLLFAVSCLFVVGFFLGGGNFPQREFVICKLKFYYRMQGLRSKSFRKPWWANVKHLQTPPCCHSTWMKWLTGDHCVFGSFGFLPRQWSFISEESWYSF